MAKRKTSCGNARRCSMLLTNVTRSASYEALPNHRPLPAKSGLTSRLPLRNRCLWEKADETAAKALQRRGEGQDFLGGAASSELLWKSEMRLRSDKSGMLWVDRVADRRC